ncbi:hypothetical protein N7457_000649 [Penicillium paradoxum]|uniref:uncharacterized protein n=1 Tax=Penicillium paradoxum TaxID=176176 RepID=UPI002547C48B|nr:uncharacterized protein N7457_000649 [Penicillium paradoxum]KAJ5794050.1 hypothetical protein N7457_000649 [Penicillium paradoxum]
MAIDGLKLLGNYSFALNSDPSDPFFHICWRRQSCSSCLTGDVACSWCAIVSQRLPLLIKYQLPAQFSRTILATLIIDTYSVLASPFLLFFTCHLRDVRFILCALASPAARMGRVQGLFYPSSRSSTCVPNPSRFPIFAPIGSSIICPLGSKERWEMRALPFGCDASTLTVLSVIVAMLGTLALGGVVVGVVWLVRRTRRWKEAEYERIDGEEQGSSAWQSWDLGLASIVGLFPYWSRMGDQTEAEEGEDAAETRPLLE